ncbi:MAG: NAD-dependent epimerase/dehydratase family protein [Ramlibacter sp.]|nr:NAD-dependent epimerase/dehydratase family protein [Ramlibacter sp.]
MENSKTVLVTGANGHLGNNLVRALLERGHRVRASVRDRSDSRKSGHLPTADIELVSLDVRDGKQFEAAAAGIDTLFHVAATYKNYTANAAEVEDMVRDSIEGARSAMLAAARAGVRRVVLTSSAVTVPMVETGGRATTEEDWRTDFSSPYHRAKTLAEQEAWKLAKEHGLDLVTVLPGAILGPGFVRGTPSTDVVESIMLGAYRMGAPDANFPAVDIRDVVSGHLLAAESGATGRFLIVNDVLPSLFELARVMHSIDPSVPAAPRIFPAFATGMGPLLDWLNHKTLGTPRTAGPEFIAAIKGKAWTMSNARAKRELGWRQQFPLEQSLADTMATIRGLRSAAKAPQARALEVS